LQIHALPEVATMIDYFDLAGVVALVIGLAAGSAAVIDAAKRRWRRAR
jgi:hypothetical protein